MLSQLLQIFSFNASQYKHIIISKSSQIGTCLMQKYIKKDLPKPMGRWNNEYCSKKTDQKVDLSNEDHCGPCGQYAITKTKPIENAIVKK
jgi:hypothetical protein